MKVGSLIACNSSCALCLFEVELGFNLNGNWCNSRWDAGAVEIRSKVRELTVGFFFTQTK